MTLRRTFITLTAALLLAGAAAAQGRATILSPQEPATLMPHFDLLTLTHEVQNAVFECLFEIDETGAYQPRLTAEVPTLENGGISEDGRTYTLKLREGVAWHDGQPFTSEDVRYTWQVITDPNLPIVARTVWEEIESIETPDELTAVVTFGEPNVGFVGTASSDSCFIMPSHLLAGEDLVASGFNRKPVGTGPFMVEEWAPSGHIRMLANEEYWGGAPQLDELVVRFTSSSASLRTALQRGEAELALHLTPADVAFVGRLQGYELSEVPDIAWWQFWINNEDPILSERAVREALTYALDKQLLVDTVLGGVAEPQAAMLPASHWAHNPNVPAYEYDPERAASILDEAGWRLGSGGVRERNGQKLKLEILNIAGQTDRRQVVEIAQDLWRRAGFDVTIREIDAATFPPTMTTGDYQLAYGWFGENPEPVFSLWRNNWQNYANQEAFALLDEIPTVIDQDERAELMRAFQRTVAEDVAMLPVAARPILNAVSARLGGYQPTLSGSLMHVEEWRLD